MIPWIVHHLYCSVSLKNLQYKMISCPGHKTEQPSSSSGICNKKLGWKWLKNANKFRLIGRSLMSELFSPVCTLSLDIFITSVHVWSMSPNCSVCWAPALKRLPPLSSLAYRDDFWGGPESFFFYFSPYLLSTWLPQSSKGPHPCASSWGCYGDAPNVSWRQEWQEERDCWEPNEPS